MTRAAPPPKNRTRKKTGAILFPVDNQFSLHERGFLFHLIEHNPSEAYKKLNKNYFGNLCRELQCDLDKQCPNVKSPSLPNGAWP